MRKLTFYDIPVVLWFWLFLFTNTVVWCVTLVWVRFHLPIDSLEMSTWSHHLLWGYEKNPYVNAWLMAGVNYLSGYSDAAIYFASKLAVACCLWGVWRLGRLFLSKKETFIGVGILVTLQYFSFGAIEFNDNVLELAWWSLSASYFYSAWQSDRLRDWCLFGIFMGLGLMTKYLTLFLLLSLLGFFFWQPRTRRQYQGLGLSLGIMVLFCLPHLLWLYHNQFAPLYYLRFRLHHVPLWQDYIKEPLYFILAQLGNFLAAALVLGGIFGLKRHKPKEILSKQALMIPLSFLVFISSGPLLLSTGVAAFTGSHLHTMWGQPFLIWWGLLWVLWFRPDITPLSWRIFVLLSFVFIFINCFAYFFAITYSDAKASANYPGRAISQDIDTLWTSLFPNKPLHYIVGDRWRAGSIAYYSRYHPTTFIEANTYYAPWIEEKDLLKQGGVVVWDEISPQWHGIPAHIQRQFPSLQYGQSRTYFMLRDPTHKILYLGIAFLPPQP